MTIRQKLILLYGGLLTLVVIMFGFAVLHLVRWTMIDIIDNTLGDTATTIITNSDAYPYRRELDGPVVIGVALAPLDIFRASGVYVQVWQNIDDEWQFSSASANLGSYRKPLDSTGLGKTEAYYNTVTINGTEWRILTRPINVQRRLWGNVQVAASLETVNQTTKRMLGIIAMSGGLIIIGVGGLGLWFSNRALRPVEEISRAAAHIADADDLGTRLTWNGPMDELGRMVAVFNRMMERLQHLFSVQQRFVADVSHELRTPLTAIQGNLEIINRYGMDQDSMDAIVGETSRMSRMVDDLLLLARADYGGLTLDFYPVDLDTVVSEVYRQVCILAKGRDLEVKMGVFEPVRVNGNPDRIKQLLINLVTNALKFTPDGGTVTIGLRRERDQGVIQVSDTGIGIAPGDQDHIFDRFYQVDPARTHTDDHAGAGLGLSIAKWIAEAHNGSINVESQVNHGTTFTIRIPIISDETPRQTDDSQKTGRIRLALKGRSHLAEPER